MDFWRERRRPAPKGWNPLHVDRGFKRAPDSVVTVMGIYPPIENIRSLGRPPAEQMQWWKYLITPLMDVNGPCSPIEYKPTQNHRSGPGARPIYGVRGLDQSYVCQSFLGANAGSPVRVAEELIAPASKRRWGKS